MTRLEQSEQDEFAAMLRLSRAAVARSDELREASRLAIAEMAVTNRMDLKAPKTG